MLLTEADIGYGYASRAQAKRDPLMAELSIPGGSSKVVNLIKRIRRLAPDKARRLRSLQVKIAKLQREHTELIGTLWGDGEVVTPVELVRMANLSVEHGDSRFLTTTPSGFQTFDYDKRRLYEIEKRGLNRRQVEASLEPKLEVRP
jgi:hypothetical protein